MATMVHKCPRGSCFSLTGAPKCAHAKADADTVVLRLLDPERDPADRDQHRRDLTGEYWRDVGDRYAQRALDAEAERTFAKMAHAARATLLDRLAGSSVGAGTFVPPVQLRYVGSYSWPV